MIYKAAPPRRGGERSERASASVALAKEGGCSLVPKTLLGCGYQKTTTPVVFDAIPSFAGGDLFLDYFPPPIALSDFCFFICVTINDTIAPEFQSLYKTVPYLSKIFNVSIFLRK